MRPPSAMTTHRSPLAELPPARRTLLLALRRAGEAGADELADGLRITASAVRQQLRALAARELVVHRDVAVGRGRPRRLYALGPRAQALFPSAHGELGSELLAYVEDEDPELLGRVFERRRKARVLDAQARLGGRDFAGRVEELAHILDEAGYLAEFERRGDGTFRITEHNCAILAVARRHGHACTTELSFLREVLPGASVERVSHIVSGGHACVYEIAPPPAAAAA
jgi:DeoR family transcriptional regulator, suf operon transcriptional repressor